MWIRIYYIKHLCIPGFTLVSCDSPLQEFDFSSHLSTVTQYCPFKGNLIWHTNAAQLEKNQLEQMLLYSLAAQLAWKCLLQNPV